MMTAIIGLLRSHHKNDEEAITQYGFDVVIGKARLPKRKKKKESEKE